MKLWSYEVCSKWDDVHYHGIICTSTKEKAEELIKEKYSKETYIRWININEWCIPNDGCINEICNYCDDGY